MACNNRGNNFISIEGVKELAKLKNLTYLDLTYNDVGDEGAKELAKLKNLTFLDLTSYDMRYCISVNGVRDLAKLKKLTSLSFTGKGIGKEGAEELVKFKNLSLYLTYRDVDEEAEKVFAESRKDVKGLSKFYECLRKAWSENSNTNKLDEDAVIKRLFFNIAALGSEKGIRLLLGEHDKYPFLINSRDEGGRALSHFYTHSPEMQKFLFEHGLIPAQEENTGLQRISQDIQSIHTRPAVKQASFITKKLVEFGEVNKGDLNQAATSYVNNISNLLEQYQSNPVKVELLSLTKDEKERVIDRKLCDNDPMLDNKEFVKTIISRARQALEEKYLRKNRDGQYDGEFSTYELQYDYTTDNAKVTIPKCIDYIKLLIDKFSIPLKERKELLVTLMEQKPESVRTKLSAVKRELGDSDILDKEQLNKTELHELLNGIDDGEKVNKLFKEISDLDIEKIWREQKEFVLLRQVYMAATTYGENGSACITGVWVQIINSVTEISAEIMEQCGRYLEGEQKSEAQDVITKESIRSFAKNLAKKLIQYARDNQEFREDFVDNFILQGINLDRPESIQFEKQRVLAKINQEFSTNIKGFLPNYGRGIPKEGEYKIIIEKLFEIGIIKDFVLEGDDQLLPQILTQSNEESITAFSSQEAGSGHRYLLRNTPARAQSQSSANQEGTTIERQNSQQRRNSSSSTGSITERVARASISRNNESITPGQQQEPSRGQEIQNQSHAGLSRGTAPGLQNLQQGSGIGGSRYSLRNTPVRAKNQPSSHLENTTVRQQGLQQLTERQGSPSGRST